MVHPCWKLKISLRTAAKIVAMVDLGLSFLCLKLLTFSLIIMIPIATKDMNQLKTELGISVTDFVIIIIGVFTSIITGVLAFLLYFGAEQKNYRYVDCWFKSMIAILVLLLPVFALQTVGIFDILLHFAFYLYSFYQFWIVYELLGELKGSSSNNNRPERNGTLKKCCSVEAANV